MFRKLGLLLIAAMLVLPSLAFAQSLAFQFDIGGSDTGLYSHTPDNPNDGSWTYLGGTIPLPTVEEEADVIAMDADANGVMFGVDVFLNILGTINPANGDFTTVAPLSGDVPPNVQAMTIDGSDVAWVTDGDGLWMMDLSTGVCAQVAAQFTDTSDGSQVTGVFAIATDGAGRFWAFDPGSPANPGTDTLWRLDETTGELTALGTFVLGDANFSNNGMDWDPVSGQLYADIYTGSGSGSYGTWNLITGEFSEILSHSAFPMPMTNRVGGPIVCFGGTTFQMNAFFDTFQSYDTPDPTSNFTVAPQPTGTQLYAMDFDPAGTLHAVDNGGKQIGTIDTTTGVFTPTFLLSGDLDLFATVTGIAYDPTARQFYLTTDVTLYRLDPTTGNTELVADYDGENTGPVPDTVIEIAVDENGNMFLFTIGDDRLYSVDKSTAVCTEVGVAPNGFNADFIQGLDFDPDTNILYGSLLSHDGDGLYGTWDTSTGLFTTIEPFTNLPQDTDFFEFKLAIRGTVKAQIPADGIFIDLGSINSGGLPEIADSDDVRLVLDPRFLQFRYQLQYRVTATSPTEFPSELVFFYESSVSNIVGTVDQRIALFNYNTGQFEQVDTRFTSPTETLVTVVVTGDPSRFIQAGTRAMEARFYYQNSFPFWVFSTQNLYLPYRVRVDQILWSITP